VLLLLCVPIVFSDAEVYNTKGVSRDNTFQQDGTGVWAGRTAVTKQYTISKSLYNSPLVSDLNGDGQNEIVVIDGVNLKILNYSVDVGITNLDIYDLGKQNVYTTAYPFYLTPALIDYDADGFIEIIAFNFTHMMILQYNTSLTLEKSVATTLFNNVASTSHVLAPTIKCAPSGQVKTGNVTCVMAYINKSVSVTFGFMFYDLDANKIYTDDIVNVANSAASPDNMNYVDLDSDGYLEPVMRRYDTVNDKIYIYKGDLTAAGVASITLLDSHDLGVNGLFTDIIVSNLDGVLSNGQEITWGYTSDGINWQGYTIDKDGADVETSYCGVLDCPEGESASFNMFVASDTTYSDFSGDVCYYVRNLANNDPAPNTDTVHCLSLYAGVGTSETTVANTQSISTYPIIHEVALQGTTGILINQFFIEGGTVKTYPNLFGTDTYLFPVDYQQSGTLDVIGLNGSRLVYYDDAYTNTNVQITRLDVDTGNPVCQYEVVGFTAYLEDDVDNIIQCHLQEVYTNGTNKAVHDNTSLTVLPPTLTLNYVADETGTYFIKYNCRDQFHTTYTSKSYTISVSNDTAVCNIKGTDPFSESYFTTEQETSDADFDAATDEFWSNIGASSRKARNSIAIILALLIAVGIYIKTQSTAISIASVPMSLLLCFFIGLATIFPVVVMIIFTITILVYVVMSGRATGV